MYTISAFCTEEDVDIISSTSNDFSCHMNWRNLKGEELRSDIVNRSVKLPKKYVRRAPQCLHRYDNDDVRERCGNGTWHYTGFCWRHRDKSLIENDIIK